MDKMEQIADSKLLQVASRFIQLIGIPAGLAFMFWIASGINEAGTRLTRLETEMKITRHQMDSVIEYRVRRDLQ